MEENPPGSTAQPGIRISSANSCNDPDSAWKPRGDVGSVIASWSHGAGSRYGMPDSATQLAPADANRFQAKVQASAYRLIAGMPIGDGHAILGQPFRHRWGDVGNRRQDGPLLRLQDSPPTIASPLSQARLKHGPFRVVPQASEFHPGQGTEGPFARRRAACEGGLRRRFPVTSHVSAKAPTEVRIIKLER